MMRKILFWVFILSGCQSIRIPPQYVYEEVETSYFKIAVWKKELNPNEPVKFYIEGDGRAFRASGHVSFDPTPRGTLLREIAFGDHHENVVYVARPCQFIQNKSCQAKYWSNARFAKEVIQSEYEVVKKIAGHRAVTLVGFSGGAQVSGLMAVQYPDLNISKLVTIAGNLDVRAWTDYHHLPNLDLSDDLSRYREQYAVFPQVHYVGMEDDNIIPEITENFVTDLTTLKYIKEASHNRGWEAVYDQIRAE